MGEMKKTTEAQLIAYEILRKLGPDRGLERRIHTLVQFIEEGEAFAQKVTEKCDLAEEALQDETVDRQSMLELLCGDLRADAKGFIG